MKVWYQMVSTNYPLWHCFCTHLKICASKGDIAVLESQVMGNVSDKMVKHTDLQLSPDVKIDSRTIYILLKHNEIHQTEE